jgi:hypothetical protein
MGRDRCGSARPAAGRAHQALAASLPCSGMREERRHDRPHRPVLAVDAVPEPRRARPRGAPPSDG